MRILFLALLLALTNPVLGQSAFKSFFSPLPKPVAVAEGSESKVWRWRPVVALPAIRFTQSAAEDEVLAAGLFTSVGGGISYQHLIVSGEDEAKWKSSFSWSPITLLVSGNFQDGNSNLNLSPCTTVGFFNNLIMIGGGIDLGKKTGPSRLFGVLSIGVNFNN